MRFFFTFAISLFALGTVAFAGGGHGGETIKGLGLLTLFGRFHPLLVHFPIGLIPLAGFLELFRRRGTKMPVGAIPLLLTLGAVSAVVAMAAGWTLASMEGGDSELIFYHRWAGVTVAFTSVFAAIFSSAVVSSSNGDCSSRSGGGITWLYRLCLYASVLAICIGGHLGAMLTHGDIMKGIFTEVKKESPAHEEEESGHGKGADAKSRTVDFVTQVKPIFADNCYRCHGPNKQKSFLRLDKTSGIFKDNPTEWVIKPGNAKGSPLYKLISAPGDAKDKMPPKGNRLSKKEIATIKKWIDEGANWPDPE